MQVTIMAEQAEIWQRGYEVGALAHGYHMVKFNARTDVHEAADTLCIYFDDPTMFAPEKIVKGYEYMAERTSREIQLRHIVCIINSAKGLELKTFDFQ